MWESDILPTEYYCQCLHYMIVRNDLHGVCLTVRLKYFKYEETLGKQVLECVVTKDIWVFREDVKEDIEKVENSEIKFIVENLRPKKMPKIKIKF